MTTTAFDDQFTSEPEPVHHPYSTADILRRNVADLELALKKQTERAEAAEAELLAVREDNHSMMVEIDGLRKELAKLRGQKPVAWINLNKWTPSNGPRCVTREEYEKERELLTKLTAVYAAPVPAVPAPAVPDDWREVMAELAADLQASIEAEHAYRDQYSSVMRKYQNDMRIVERARSLLQSTEVTK